MGSASAITLLIEEDYSRWRRRSASACPHTASKCALESDGERGFAWLPGTRASRIATRLARSGVDEAGRGGWLGIGQVFPCSRLRNE